MNKHAHAKAYDEAKQHIEETKTKKKVTITAFMVVHSNANEHMIET